MQGVEGQWNGQLLLNGKEVPLHMSSLVQLVEINSIHQHLPSLSVTFKDMDDHFLASLGIRDGSEVELTLGDGGFGQTPAMRFNTQGDLQIRGGFGGNTISFNAVLDNIQWLRQIVSGAVKGTSGDAISRVAAMAGLRPEIHPTSDLMVWLPNNKPLASYARHVMERGWASATSCMLLGVSDDMSVRYFDLDKLISSSASQIFGLDGLPILQYMVNSKSQLYNNVAGYGSTSTNLSPEGIFKELTKIDVTMLSENLAASARNIGLIGASGGRIEPRALDVGNVHKMWNEAMHQNRRIRSLYAHDVQILIDRVSGVKLLDMVDVVLPGYDGGRLTMESGSYIVSAFTRMLSGNRYLEKLTLTAQSSN